MMKLLVSASKPQATLCCVAVITAVLSSKITSANKKELIIGAIFPMSADLGGWPGGQACLPAAELALEDVNNRGDILSGYKLRMVTKDSQCQAGLGAKVMYELLYSDPAVTKVVLLAGCSLVTTLVAEAAHLWNLIVVSYGGSSPALSDRERFPTLFRTHPSATIQNPTRLALLKAYEWSKIGILHSVEEVHKATAEDLEDLCQNNGISVNTRVFSGEPGDAMQNLKRSDIRIIVGLFYEAAARKVFCEAFLNGMYGPKFMWLLIGWFADDWYVPKVEDALNCTLDQMKEAAQYHFTTEALMWAPSSQVGYSKIGGWLLGCDFDYDRKEIEHTTPGEFQIKLDSVLKTVPTRTGGYVESPLAYDAIWAIALALNCTEEKLRAKGQSLEEFDYHRKDIKDQLYACMMATKFQGISGPVLFSEEGDRILVTKIEQMQNGEYVHIGTYDVQSHNLSINRKAVQFYNDRPPPDSIRVQTRLVHVNRALLYPLNLAAALVILISIACMAFNLVFRERRFIHQSQPICNSVMCVGCLISSMAVFLYGIDGALVPPSRFSILCQSRVFVMMYGFSLAYGAMFSKVWRAHRMSAKEVRDKPVADWKLWVLVVVLLCVDSLILVCWAAVDPLVRRLENFTLEKAPSGLLEDTEIMPQLEHCSCRYLKIWIGVVYGYKGLLLLFGIFLAYDTRSVKVKFINDSRFVGMAIYNVVILCVITGPVSMIIVSQADASFAFVAATIVFCTSISLGLIFVPKLVHVYRVPRNDDYRVGDGVSKEDEERYKKILAENEDIKRQIAEKEVRIRDLRRRLEERLANSASTQPTASLSCARVINGKSNGEVSEAKGTAPSKTNLGFGQLIVQANPDSSDEEQCTYDAFGEDTVTTTAAIELTSQGMDHEGSDGDILL